MPAVVAQQNVFFFYCKVEQTSYISAAHSPKNSFWAFWLPRNHFFLLKVSGKKVAGSGVPPSSPLADGFCDWFLLLIPFILCVLYHIIINYIISCFCQLVNAKKKKKKKKKKRTASISTVVLPAHPLTTHPKLAKAFHVVQIQLPKINFCFFLIGIYFIFSRSNSNFTVKQFLDWNN